MTLQFPRARPVQACKLAATIIALLFAAGGIFEIIPDQGFTGLFGIIFLSLALALVITAETLHAGYHSVGSSNSLTDQFANRQMYTVVRAVEVVSAAVSVGGLVLLFATLADEPPEGPGAIGLLFIVTGISLVVLGGSLVRTMTEYYDYRRTNTA